MIFRSLCALKGEVAGVGFPEVWRGILQGLTASSVNRRRARSVGYPNRKRAIFPLVVKNSIDDPAMLTPAFCRS